MIRALLLPGDLIVRPDWFDDAACRDTDPEVFFPTRGEMVDVAAAKAICRECRVRAQCLEMALVDNEKFGIWGGMSERQRRAIRRQRRRAS